ncbi:MAG: hypothetical protein PHZ00_02510, partial [Candidatus Peribacteraceae bacterium]|nr:hypothetical protein [Candidatus Peribacteraceae bacterium]
MKQPLESFFGEARLLRFADGQGDAEVIAMPEPDTGETPSAAKTLKDIQREWEDALIRTDRLLLHARENPELLKQLNEWWNGFMNKQEELTKANPKWKTRDARDIPNIEKEMVDAWKNLKSEELDPWLNRFEKEAKINPGNPVEQRPWTLAQITDDLNQNILPKCMELRGQLPKPMRDLFDKQWEKLEKTKFASGRMTDARRSKDWQMLRREMLALIEEFKSNRTDDTQETDLALKNFDANKRTGAGDTQQARKNARPVVPEIARGTQATAPGRTATSAQSAGQITEEWNNSFAPRINALGAKLTPQEQAAFKAQMKQIQQDAAAYYPQSNESIAGKSDADVRKILKATALAWEYAAPQFDRLIGNFERT